MGWLAASTERFRIVSEDEFFEGDALAWTGESPQEPHRQARRAVSAGLLVAALAGVGAVIAVDVRREAVPASRQLAAVRRTAPGTPSQRASALVRRRIGAVPPMHSDRAIRLHRPGRAQSRARRLGNVRTRFVRLQTSRARPTATARGTRPTASGPAALSGVSLRSANGARRARGVDATRQASAASDGLPARAQEAEFGFER